MKLPFINLREKNDHLTEVNVHLANECEKKVNAEVKLIKQLETLKLKPLVIPVEINYQ